MSSQRIPSRALLADAGSVWKRRRDGQCMTWCRGMKEGCKGMAYVGPSRLPGWGFRDGATHLMSTSRILVNWKHITNDMVELK
ncbi:unnamed protein product [Schistosoma mattheei]|uniref:Uncharacterized protein n=1 Tax=Schistosoma mattheei TaxID=31246 RepID=A0A183NZS1_9TREM|nr:unnamed protein product [Schistosoma mattheei]